MKLLRSTENILITIIHTEFRNESGTEVVIVNCNAVKHNRDIKHNVKHKNIKQIQ